jgi:hypothetical protein
MCHCHDLQNDWLAATCFYEFNHRLAQAVKTWRRGSKLVLPANTADVFQSGRLMAPKRLAVDENLLQHLEFQTSSTEVCWEHKGVTVSARAALCSLIAGHELTSEAACMPCHALFTTCHCAAEHHVIPTLQHPDAQQSYTGIFLVQRSKLAHSVNEGYPCVHLFAGLFVTTQEGSPQSSEHEGGEVTSSSTTSSHGEGDDGAGPSRQV